MRTTWDEAVDTIAAKFSEIKEKYGPEAVGFGLGEPRGMEFAYCQRFASAFGTPSVVTPAWFCGVAEPQGQVSTYGWSSVPDDFNTPEVIVMWGCNSNHTSGAMRREILGANIQKGSRLIVVDPMKTDSARVADIWVRPRPGSDLAVVLGVLKVVIEEKLYDEEIVSHWAVGFDKLKEHVKTFSLEDVEKVSWVPRKQIEEFGRLQNPPLPEHQFRF